MHPSLQYVKHFLWIEKNHFSFIFLQFLFTKLYHSVFVEFFEKMLKRSEVIYTFYLDFLEAFILGGITRVAHVDVLGVQTDRTEFEKVLPAHDKASAENAARQMRFNHVALEDLLLVEPSRGRVECLIRSQQITPANRLIPVQFNQLLQTKEEHD